MLFHVSQSAQVGGLDSAASCQNNTPRRFVSAIVYTDRVIGAKNIQRATGKEAGERIFSEKKKQLKKAVLKSKVGKACESYFYNLFCEGYLSHSRASPVPGYLRWESSI